MAASFASVGVLGGVTRSNQERTGTGPTGESHQSGWHTGIFAELGAAYLIIPHVSLGVITSVEGRYSRARGWSSDTGPYQQGYSTRSSSRSLSMSTEILSAVVTVYF